MSLQHYQKDADGLCCRLKYSIDKKDDVSVVVNMEDFEKRGWSIKKKDIIKKNIIGKGEFGGEWSGVDSLYWGIRQGCI